jgi:hypothetical protein
MVVRSRPSEIKSPLLSVTDGTNCVGFILARGPRGFEAFDRDGKSLGLFPNQSDAVRAIPRRIEERAR